MSATYDVTTDIGKIRLFIGDTDVTPASDAIFTDEELQVFLDIEGSVRSAAAAAIEALANDSARTAKMLRTLNFQKDTRQAAKAMLDTAQRLRDTDVQYAFAEQSITDAATADLMLNKALRAQ
jgi:hypothetical protein